METKSKYIMLSIEVSPTSPSKKYFAPPSELLQVSDGIFAYLKRVCAKFAWEALYKSAGRKIVHKLFFNQTTEIRKLVCSAGDNSRNDNSIIKLQLITPSDSCVSLLVRFGVFPYIVIS